MSSGFVNGLDVPFMIAIGSLETHYGKIKPSGTIENFFQDPLMASERLDRVGTNILWLRLDAGPL